MEKVLNMEKVLTRKSQVNSVQATNPNWKTKIECRYCHKMGHLERECRKKQWDAKRGERTKGVSANAVWLLDSGASQTICNDESLLRNKKISHKSIRGFNGSTYHVEKQGDLRNIKDVLVCPDCPNNLISFGQLKDQGYTITYEDAEDEFIATKEKKIIKFTRINNSNLYGIESTALNATASEEDSPEPTKKVELSIKEKEIETLHSTLGHPSDQNLLKMCLQLEKSITSMDIKRYRSKVGPCVACLKGKLHEIPARSHDHNPEADIGELLHCDILNFGITRKKFQFLLTVDHATGYVHTMWINKKDGASIYNALESIYLFYSAYGHKIKTLSFDNELGIRKIEEKLNKMGISVVLTSPYRHEHHAERYIRTIKDIARTILMANEWTEEFLSRHDLLVTESISQASFLWNNRPNSRTGSNYPRVLVTNTKTKERELTHSFGTRGYTKTHNEDKDVGARAEEVIFIGTPLDTLGFKLYDPRRRSCFIRHDFKETKDQEWALETNAIDKILMENDSIGRECESMLDLGVFEFMDPNQREKESAIGSQMLTKWKHDPNGKLTKVKSRLVARGDQQTNLTFDEIRASTVDKKCLFICLALMKTNEDWKMVVSDVPSAYLHANIDKEIYMKLEKKSREYYLKTRPELRDFLDQDGNLIVRLKKSLYGLKQAGYLWQKELTSYLVDFGLAISKSEPCVLFGEMGIILFHVDDLFIFYRDCEWLENLKRHLIKKFGDMDFDSGPEFHGLGMRISDKNSHFEVSQPGYIQLNTFDNNVVISV